MLFLPEEIDKKLKRAITNKIPKNIKSSNKILESIAAQTKKTIIINTIPHPKTLRPYLLSRIISGSLEFIEN